MYQTHILTPNGHSIPRTRLTMIDLWDILDYMELREEEVTAVADYGFSKVSYGDAAYTLVSSTYALDGIVNGLLSYYDELESDVDEHGQPHRSLPARLYTRKDIEEMFWAVVGENDFINLEA